MQFKRALQHTIAWKSLNTALAFFINLLLVRILGAAVSGDFFYSLAMLAFFTLASSWSLESGITYYASKDNGNIPAITSFLIPWVLFQAICLWLLLRFIEVNLDARLAAAYILANLCIAYFSALFYARKWVFTVNIIACLVNAVVLAALAMIYFNQQPAIQLSTDVSVSIGPEGPNVRAVQKAVFVFFGGFLLQAVLLALVFFAKSGIRFAGWVLNKDLIRKLFVYSTIAFVSNLLFFLVTRIDYYFVKRFCDEVSLGNYVQVSRMGQLLVLLPSMMAAVIFPYSSGEDKEQYLDKLQLLCRGITLLFIPVSGAIAAVGFWLFPWLFGPGFNQVYSATLWYLPGFYSLSILTLLAAYLAGRSMVRVNLLASLLALLVVIIADLVAIPLWGINGAAAASSIAYFSCLCFLLWIYKTKLNIPAMNFWKINKTDLQRIGWRGKR